MFPFRQARLIILGKTLMRMTIGCWVALMLFAGCGEDSKTPEANPQVQEAPPATQPSDDIAKTPAPSVEVAEKDSQGDKASSDEPSKNAGLPIRVSVDLESPHTIVRLAAVKSLGDGTYDPNLAIPALLPMLNDKMPEVADTARETLQAIAWKPQTVLVDFYADWCPPCRVMKPIIAELDKEGHPIVEVDVDLHPDLAEKFNVASIPTFALIQGDQVITQSVGAVSKTRLLSMLRQIPKTAEADRSIASEWQVYGPLMALSNENAWVRFQALGALASQGETYGPRLMELVQDQEQPGLIRVAAVEALVRGTTTIRRRWKS